MVCFFSSRRRHTRLQGDWSSDVCSSDLSFKTRPAVVEPIPAQVLADHRRDEIAGLVLNEPRGGRLDVENRSEERRVGEECRSRWSPDHLKKKKNRIEKQRN